MISTSKNNNIKLTDDKNINSYETEYNSLIKFFISQSTKKLKRSIKYFIANDKDLESLSQHKKIELLFISYIYNMDREFVSKYYIFDENPLYEKHKELYELLQSDTNKAGTKQLFDDCVGKFIFNNRNNLGIRDEILDKIIQKNYKYFKKVEIIDSKKEICEKHKMLLENKRFFIDIIDDFNNEKVISLSSKCCAKCNKAYLDYKECEKINNMNAKYKLKIDNLDQYNSKIINSFESSKNKIHSNSFKEIDLNEKSEANKLGYSLKEGRENRIRILKYKVIPELGKEKIINHIEWLIKVNGNKQGMENSLGEWKYDLSQIEKL